MILETWELEAFYQNFPITNGKFFETIKLTIQVGIPMNLFMAAFLHWQRNPYFFCRSDLRSSLGVAWPRGRYESVT